MPALWQTDQLASQYVKTANQSDITKSRILYGYYFGIERRFIRYLRENGIPHSVSNYHFTDAINSPNTISLVSGIIYPLQLCFIRNSGEVIPLWQFIKEFMI